jgi:hypothetical protein
MFVTVNSALLGLRFQERSQVRLRSQMTVPNITRSIALRAVRGTGWNHRPNALMTKITVAHEAVTG